MSPPTYPAPTSQALSCFQLPAVAGTAHLVLVGELDLVTADRAREALRRAQDESRVLVCDLGDVWFVDLAGLRVLLEATARARHTGALMTVAHYPPMLPRMLRLLGLEDALELQAASDSGDGAHTQIPGAPSTSRLPRPAGET
jgi:anti-anti-sigma factor